MLNVDQLTSILRALTPIITFLVTKYGLGTDTDAAAMWTAATSLIVAAWGTYSHTQTAMIQSVNNATNGVKVVAATSSAPQVDAPITPAESK